MINEIKLVIENYINNIKPCAIMTGTVATEGIQVSEKLFIPEELIIDNLKQHLLPGCRVRLLRNHGGQQFFILEVIENDA